MTNAEPSEFKKIDTKDISKKDSTEIIETTPDHPRTVNRSELEKSDREELGRTMDLLKSEMKKNEGWEVVRRPREQWREEHEITTDSPFDRLKGWLKSFSRSERVAKKTNKELQREFAEDRTKYPERGFDYKKGAGVEGMTGNRIGILAKGFGECSGLVFQTPDKVAVVHISPNTFRDAFEGGELVKDKDVYGHIRFALKELLSNKREVVLKRTENNTNLNKEQIAELQRMVDSGDLSATMLSGEDSLVPHEITMEFGKLAKFRNLPYIKTGVHYVGAIGGEGGYAIYASPEDMYYIGSNGKVMKRGKNLPPAMYEYKNKK